MSRVAGFLTDTEVLAIMSRRQSSLEVLSNSKYGIEFFRLCYELNLSFMLKNTDAEFIIQLGGYSLGSSSWSDYCIGTANMDMPETQGELYERGMQIRGETIDHALRRALIFLKALRAMEMLDAEDGST